MSDARCMQRLGRRRAGRDRRRAGLTLVELLLVLFILAVLATVALRSTETLVDQSRYEASKRTMANVEGAVIGGVDHRQPEGTVSVRGFVADAGRLPVTSTRLVEVNGLLVEVLSADELWDGEKHFASSASRYDIRQATAANGVAGADADAEVFVAAGWRGPYLRLPSGTPDQQHLRDGFGTVLANAVGVIPDFEPHLFDLSGAPLDAEGQPVEVVRSFGPDDGSVYDRTLEARFAPTSYKAYLRVTVRVQRGDEDGDPATPPSRDDAEADPNDTITVRVFCPDPANVGRVKAVVATAAFSAPSVTLVFPVDGDDDDLTIGPRVVRAYFNDDYDAAAATGTLTSSFDAGAATDVTLQSGLNTLGLTIDRNRAP